TCGILGLHTAGFHPETLVLVVSPSQKQSGELHRTITSLYETARANGAALPDVEQSSALRTEFTNGSRIVALPGSEATVRGYPAASLVLIDEASRVTDELVAAIQPTLATTNGRLIALSTPCGKRGFFWREWNGGIGWERTEVPVTDCPRIEQAFLDDQRHQLGEWTYGAEYLCRFYDAETSVFSSDLITRALSDAFEPFLSSAL
ncbi:MAG: terminase, partial [Gemmatimonadales bacterium]